MATIALLAGGEVLLRLGDDFGRNGPGRIGHQWLDDTTYVHFGGIWSAREFAPEIELNREGFHAAPFDADPARPVRVAVLGDSYVLGEQMTRGEGMVARAESLLTDVQMLALGANGLYAPLQRDLFLQDFPDLFGDAGRYPPVDAVVFCVRPWGGLNIARGTGAYDVTKPAMPWSWKLKAPFVRRLEFWLRRGVLSPSHAVSFVSHRLSTWAAADLRNQENPLDDASLDFAADVLRTEVFEVVRAEAASRGVPIAFLYLPTIAEQTGAASRAERGMRDRTQQILDGLGLPWRDASAVMGGEESFWPHDRHPNARGHREMGEALAGLVAAMELVR